MHRRPAHQRGHLPPPWQAEHARQVLRHEAHSVRVFTAIILATVVTWVVLLAVVVFHL